MPLEVCLPNADLAKSRLEVLRAPVNQVPMIGMAQLNAIRKDWIVQKDRINRLFNRLAGTCSH